MNKLRLIREALDIWRRFGTRHLLHRLRDYRLAKRDNLRRQSLYVRLKPNMPTVEKNILGNLMRLDLNDNGIHRDLFLDGIREPIATDHTMRVLAPGDVVLEIGANIGYYVLLASSRCKHVYAVEPHPDNFDNLKHNLTLNGCTNVDAFQLALGDRRGTAKLNVSPNANWHSFHPVQSAARQIEVEMDTVDHFLANKPAPTFARMDVEGFELSVVRGMPNLLRTLKRLFLEIHADILALEETRELLDTLHAAGFRPELIAKYDRPGLAQSLPLNHLETIYRGDKGVYEVFFTRGTC